MKKYALPFVVLFMSLAFVGLTPTQAYAYSHTTQFDKQLGDKLKEEAAKTRKVVIKVSGI